MPLAAISSQLLNHVQLLERKHKLDTREAVEIAVTLIRIKPCRLLPQEPASVQASALAGSNSARRTLIEDLDSLRLSVERLREMWAHALPAESARFDPPSEPDPAVEETGPSVFDLIRHLEEALHLTRNAPPPLSYRQDAYPIEELAAWLLARLSEVEKSSNTLFLNKLLNEMPHVALGVFLAALELARSGNFTLSEAHALDEVSLTVLDVG